MGFLNIPQWINDNMSGTDSKIYSVIYNAAFKKGYFDGSVKMLCEITNLSRRTIQYHLHYLEDVGAIEEAGRNSYKNIKYVPLLNEDNIYNWEFSKGAKNDNQRCKGAKVQRCKTCTPNVQNLHPKGAKLAPHKNINSNKTINKHKEGISINTNSQKADAFLEVGGNKKMFYSWYKEDSFDKFKGWWKHYIFFKDDEELNDLFIKFLDKTAADNNEHKDGCRIAFDLVDTARIKTQYSDEELFNMSDEKMNAIPVEDLKPMDQTEELKQLLRDFAYNGNKHPLFNFIGIE